MSNLSSDVPENPDVIKNPKVPAQPEQPGPPKQSKQDEPPPTTNAEPDQKTDPDVDAKTRANRENAQKSTGPRTPAGKEASSRNAIKHGLFAEELTRLLSAEQLEAYQGFVEGVVKDLHPVGDLELHLAQRVADIQFRLELLRTPSSRFTSAV